MTNPDALAEARWRLPARVQLAILAVVFGVGAVLVLAAAALHPRHPPPVKPAAPPPGFFRPTGAQWTSLTVKPVSEVEFRPELRTDGRIAGADTRTTQVFSQFSGRVLAVYAQAGQVVARGATLFTIDASEAVQANADLATAQGNLATARTQLSVAQANEYRQHELYKLNGAAQRDWQQSQLDLRTAQSSLRSAEAGLAAVQGRLRVLGQSRATAGVTSVKAPIGGIVLQRQVGSGQYVNSVANGASTPLFSIANLSSVWAIANVREADAGQVRYGDRLEFRVLAYPGRVFLGRVNYVSPTLDANTRRFAVRAELANPQGLLKPDMFGEATIITGQGRSALAVPEQAVLYEGEEARVWVARPDHTLGLRKVRTGAVRDGMVEIVSGLSAGEQVVTAGSLFIDRAAASD